MARELRPLDLSELPAHLDCYTVRCIIGADATKEEAIAVLRLIVASGRTFEGPDGASYRATSTMKVQHAS